ncbi:kelch repeat protein [Verticillium dahliae VdLs.17]|uniref:Kelch repeat protein n=1 Tax=Verticillium dahliae (strain VdLs.17 / ATCC MYA-4575 / FGSC 10137) TaxID=498257 RepID=G2X8F0_VERDV|nr:kelch repeat protein [Verticillium dahliae VdLs.17]EGY15237.1 kelch repeat protein [Verticillium dahliae VdLs.17]
MAAQPGTPGASTPSLFGGPTLSTPSANTNTLSRASSSLLPSSSGPGPSDSSPGSDGSANNTYIMPNSPIKNRTGLDGYRPKVTKTLGQRPACLVNASVTYCGNNTIYAFGGFDQYTDEVYNHVLKLDLNSHQWSLIDNYGDIPGVRMGHTATMYAGDKLLVFGGENEHRTYLSDLIVFDLKTAHWTMPQTSGPKPKGRARHAAVLHEDKLFIVGGITGNDNYVLDDICYLDLKTFTWSRSWRFVGRFDHSVYIWNDRVWVFGGMGEDMDKTGDLWWLDLKGSPAFDSAPNVGIYDRNLGTNRAVGSPRPPYSLTQTPAVGTSGYAANSRTQQVNPPSFQMKTYAPPAPGTISSLKFVGGPSIPPQGSGIHFHVYSSGTLLDFVTPAVTTTSKECSLSALDLQTLRWQKLAEGREIFKSGYRWHYCTMNEDGTKAWLLGCPTDPPANDLGPNGFEEYLSDIMEIDLRKYGFLGNHLASEPVTQSRPTRAIDQPSRGLGADLASLFDQPPESGSGADFVITALAGGWPWDEESMPRSGEDTPDQNWLAPGTHTSQPIHVHKLILQARWPHFARLYNSQMAEFHTKKMHIPEPYSVVRAFLYYLYTDSIHGTSVQGSEATTELADVAGLLVMSNIYGLPRLRLLCVNRLLKELDVDHACIIWHSAGLANEEWLRKRAAQFCLLHWGRIVRTEGISPFTPDSPCRIVSRDRHGGPGRWSVGRKQSFSSQTTQMLEDDPDDEEMS